MHEISRKISNLTVTSSLLYDKLENCHEDQESCLVISARDMDSKERKLYERRKQK
jgi:uncharacterized DUF497 family protein